MCVCVCVGEREYVTVCARENVCMCVWGRERKYVTVCAREREIGRAHV